MYFRNRHVSLTRLCVLLYLLCNGIAIADEIDLGGLRFSAATFVHEKSGVSYSTDAVSIGFAPSADPGADPSAGHSFSPLLLLPNGIRIVTDPKKLAISTNGEIQALGKAGKKHVLYSGALTIPLEKLTKKVEVGKRELKFGGLTFSVSSFQLAKSPITPRTNSLANSLANSQTNPKAKQQANGELRLQGNLTLPSAIGLTLAVEKDNYVSISSAGIQLEGGSMSVTKSFYLGPIQVKAKKLNATYDQKKDVISISGTLSLPAFWDATTTLPAKGLQIKEGKVELHGLSLSLSDVHLGVAELSQIKLGFTESAKEIDIDVEANLEVIDLFELDTEIELVNGVPDHIHMDFKAKGPGSMIPIADSGLFINELGGDLNHLYKDSEELTLEINAGIQVGDLSTTPLELSGDMTVNRDGWKLKGEVEFEKLSGNTDVGKGNALIDLEWGAGIYTVAVNLTLIDIFDIDDNLTINSKGDLTMLGEVSMQVPSFVPVIGDKKIASADFFLEIRPEDAKEDFAAAWVELKLLLATPTLGVKAAWNQSPVLSFVGSSEAKNIVSQYHPPTSDPIHRYTFDLDIPANTGSALFYIDWKKSAPDLNLEVTLPGGTVVRQKDFGSQKNGLAVVTQPANLAPTSTSLVLGVLNPKRAGNPFAAVQGGTYRVTLSTHTQLNLPDILFKAHYQYPQPKLTIDSIDLSASTATINYHFQSFFPADTDIQWYVDWLDPQGRDDGLLLHSPQTGPTQPPTNTAKPGQKITGTYSFDISSFIPLNYRVYGIIRDHNSGPIRSSNEKPFSPTPVLSGFITDEKHQDLSGWTVTLNGKSRSRATSSNGFWGFSHIPPGKNQVSLDLPRDWAMASGSSRVRDIEITSHLTPKLESFTVQKLSRVSGQIFEDLNRDGQLDPGDVLIANQAVHLAIKTKGQKNRLVSSVSDSQGQYEFLVPVDSTLSLSIDVPDSWQQTIPFQSAITLNTTTTGMKLDGNNFGLIETGSVRGLVFNDQNKSGHWEASDSHHAGQIIQLTPANGSGGTQLHVSSDSNGQFQFDNLYPGDYVLSLQQQPSWQQTTPRFLTFKGFGNNTQAVPGSSQAPEDLIGGDFNGDGIADIAFTTNNPASVKVFTGTGKSSFQLSRTYPLAQPSSTSTTIAATDIDQNGSIDILIWAGTFSALVNQGDGTFRLSNAVDSHTQTHQPVSNLLMADLNQDSYPDIVFANRNELVWLPNSTKGNFLKARTLAATNNAHWIHSTDFDADGKLDLILGSPDGNVDATVYRNTGNGTLTLVQQLTNGLVKNRNGLATADLDGNGVSDIVVSGATLAASFLYNSDSKRFTNGHDINHSFNQLHAADLTGNGYAELFDLATGHYFKNSADGLALFEQKDLLGPFAAKGVVFIDTNSDTMLDLVAAGSDLFIWPTLANSRLDYQLKVSAGATLSGDFGITRTGN